MPFIRLNGAVNKEIDKVSDTAKCLWQKGWAERNGGNISVNLSGLIKAPWDLGRFRHVRIKDYPEGSAGMLFFVKRTGERIRDLIKPKKGGCVVRIDDDAKGYHVIWEGARAGRSRATSEFISHVLIHLDLAESGSDHRAVVHTHPLELIALSHNPKYNHDEKLLNRVLWRMLPEVRACIPRGIAIAPYTMPGSRELAELTLAGLRRRDVVIWSKHGATASGRDALEAFDYIDVANKGAAILLKCLSSGFEPEGLSATEMAAFEREFHL